jgi:type IV pilus assembly protein PilO
MAKDSLLARLPAVAKLALGAGVVTLVGAGYYFVFYTDLSKAITAAQRRERELREELGKAKQAVAAYQQDLAELHQREQRQTEIEKVLPSEAQYPSFLSSLQSVANVSSVNLVAWTPQPEKAEEFFSRVPMSLELSGRYHQVAKFFYGVGQLDRIMNMENISFTDPKVEGDEVLVKVKVLATAFRSVPESAAPAEKSKPTPATPAAVSSAGGKR